MMETIVALLRQAVTAIKGLVKRFAQNNARNDFERMLFDSLRSLILQYGRA